MSEDVRLKNLSSVDDIILRSLFKIIDSTPNDLPGLKIYHFINDLMSPGRHSIVGIDCVQSRYPAAEPKIAAESSFGESNGTGVYGGGTSAFAFERTFTINHIGIMATRKNHASLRRAVEFYSQTIRDHIFIDP
jgi:hypothetical protein